MNAPYRYYHTLEHIYSLYENYDRLGEENDVLEWCIWFHDIIYEPRNKDNEAQSAEYFYYFLREMGITIDHRKKELIKAIILQTQNHFSPHSIEDKACDIFLDMDLAILGSDSYHYDQYS